MNAKGVLEFVADVFVPIDDGSGPACQGHTEGGTFYIPALGQATQMLPTVEENYRDGKLVGRFCHACGLPIRTPVKSEQ